MPNATRTRRRATAGRGQGFTLVELLVTVGIVALLVGLLVPAVASVRRASLETRCRSNLRQMAVALGSYLNTNEEHYPISSHTTGSVSDPSAWMQSLESHGFVGDVRRCPADTFALERPTSYATNTYFEPLVAGIDLDPFTGEPLPGGRTSAVSRLAQVPHPATTFWAVETPGAGLIDHLHSVGWTSSAQIADAVAVERHGESSNVLFADGHDSPVLWRDLKRNFETGKNPFDPEAAR
jgi:prepilin-type processing-associated H-X9-DG protein/prepilin-type N-terminal cleavage/methylation domain-containing protein